MGHLLHFMIVVNCPLTEKYMSHFRPDNIFSVLLIGEHGSVKTRGYMKKRRPRCERVITSSFLW